MAKSVVAFSLEEFDPNSTRVFMGDVEFRNRQEITNLGTLEVITGYADFRNSQVEDLGNLITIGGDADFYQSQIMDLRNLETIGGSAYFYQSQIMDLRNLETIGDMANFENSEVENLGNLTTIGGNAYFEYSQVENLGNLTTIGGDAVFRNSQVKDLGNLTTIEGTADFRDSQIESLGKLKTIKGFVSFDNQELADQWKKRSNKDNFKTGGQSLSKTPAPKKDRVYGSKKNKPESSKDTKSAEKIEFNEKTLETIKNKVAEHNKKNPKKKVTLASAKAVVRRGMGAYSSTHRPTISGGKPNSRVAWGLARLNAFFYKIINGKSKSGKYSQDDDLINELGYKVQKYADGGELKHLKYKNEGAYADVLKVSKDEWHLSMIESEIEGQGYAKKIMNQIIQDARKEKVKKITLVTSLFNKDYFEYGYGFQETGYDEFNDLFEMELKLENGGEVANIMRNEIIDILSKNAQYGKQIHSVQEVGLEVIESCIESNTYFGNAIRQANENYIMIPVNYEDKLWGIDKKVGYVYFAKPNENTKIRVEYKYDMQDYPVPILFDSEIMNSEEFYDFNDYEEIKSYKFDSEFLYRGINNDEMLSIIKNGFIKSNASMNIGKQQEETTSFAQHISQASSYAVGFNAWYDEVTFAKPKYILKVKKEGVNYKPTIETDIENEVDVYGEIPIQQIESIYEFRLGECEMGQVEIRVGYDNDFSDGSRSPMFKKVFVRKTDINSIIKSNKVQRYIDGGYLNNFVLYHGTGNANKVIQALKDDSFIFHKSAGVENGIYLTPNKKLALDYAIDTQGEDIGVLEIRFNETPNFKKYNNAGEQYYDERNYSSNPKEASIEYTKDLIKNNYDGYSTGDVYLLFKEKIDLIDINKISLVNNYSDGGDIQAYEEAMGISEFDEGGEAEEPTEFWGTEAGGVLVYCSTTQRYLILLRSEWVLEPNTWGIISGKLDDEENVQEAVLREAEEETGHKLGRLIPSFIFEKPKFKFHNFISIVDEEFIPELNWENTDYKWVKINEMPENLHFGLKLLLEKGDIPKLVANNVYVEKYADGGLIAPNGKPSNLTPEQYKLVRTKAFKDWFGDWENDPENASKVVDSNGEPLVVYHGTKENWWKDYFVFNPQYEGKSSNIKRRKFGSIYFTSKKKVAQTFGNILIPVFLNFKNPIVIDGDYHDIMWVDDELETTNYEDDIIIKNTYDYRVSNVKLDADMSSDIFLVSQIFNKIKLADGTNTTFDGSNPDIRFMAGGQVLNLNKIRKGQYEAKSDKIEISLTNPKVLNGMGTNKWQLIIEYSNDIIVNQWFDTMNEALKTGAILLSDFLDSNNTETRFMAGGRTKKAKTDRSGNPIGDGNFHVDYFVEDMTEYPQVKISVSKSDSTESVYVRYFNEDNAESITLRFSMHENNAVKFGYQLNGYTASKNEILYELGLINRKFVPNTYLSITKRQVKKVDLPKYEESNLSIKEMYDLGEGADISMHKGKIAKGSNYLIQGDTVEKIIADTGRFEYFVNGGVPKKFKFDIEEDEDEDRTEISINGVGKVILTMTYPEYEFMDNIGEDGLEELGIEEGEIIGKIEHIEINDKYKGQGYAKLLMNKAIEIAEEKGLMPLYLNASPMGYSGLDIDDLTAFYESFGFQVFLEQGNNNLMILK